MFSSLGNLLFSSPLQPDFNILVVFRSEDTNQGPTGPDRFTGTCLLDHADQEPSADINIEC